MMKRTIQILVLIILSLTQLTGCITPHTTSINPNDILKKYHVSENVLLGNLNALSNSQDPLDAYSFKHYENSHSLQPNSKAFKDSVTAMIKMDLVEKNRAVILCFPPEVSFDPKDNNGILVNNTSEWHYKLLEHKVQLTSRIIFEKKVGKDYIRSAEDVIINIQF